MQNFILIKGRGRFAKVYLSDIFFIEHDRHISIFHTNHGILIENISMYKLSEMLDERMFRCQDKYIVNMDMVSAMEDGFLYFDNGESIKLSKNRFGAVRRIIESYLESKNGYIAGDAGSSKVAEDTI